MDKKERRRAYYLKNREKEIARAQKYNEENKTLCKEARAKRYIKNKVNDLIRIKTKNEENPELTIFNSAKARAKRRGLDFDIEVSDIIIPETCPVLNIPLYKSTTGKRSNNSPSIDRIDSSKGYIKGNIKIISWRANTLKNNGAIEEFEAIIRYMREN